ncbi:MAG: WG repeat-containing protein [Lachnospiraceae bacterium]|nr:WG repeat-containing protein [Lachnospiraceae bacterium]
MQNKYFDFKVVIILVSMAFICAAAVGCNNSRELNWRWVIRPEDYEDCCLVSEDWFAVKGGDGKYSVVDEQNREVFPGKYDNIAFFREDLSVVCEENTDYFINKNGEKISGGFQEARSFCETYAAVKNGGLWGYINHDGVIIIDCQYMEADNFSEGFAAVKKNGKWGFIDQGGVYFTEYEYDEVKSFQEGLAAVMLNDKWGFLDSSGRTKIDLLYDGAESFSEGKAAVKIGSDQDYADLWAYINSDNEIVVDFFPYTSIGGGIVYVGEFHDGIAFVSNDFYSIIDENGKYLFRGTDSAFFISSLAYNAQYDAIPAYIYTDDSMKIRKYGLMSLNGEQRLEPVFDDVIGIYGDYVLVSNKVDDGELRYGFIKIWEA